MRNLIFANMTRLQKSKLFWTGIVISMAYSVFLLMMNYMELAVSPEDAIVYLNWYLLSSFTDANVFCAVFCGLFTGTEYSDGTIRNKLIAGHTRKNIYLANMLAVFWAECAVVIASCFVVITAGIFLFGFNLVYPMYFLLNFFSGILTLGTFAGLFTLLSMLINNKAASVVVCIVTYLFMFEVGCFVRVGVFKYYEGIKPASMPDGMLRNILEFLYDFIPTCQSFQVSGGFIMHPARVLLYSIASIVLMTVCGVAVFKKKNLK